MAKKTPIPPLEALEKAYGVTPEAAGAAGPWGRRRWAAAHRAVAAEGLDASAESLLVLVDAFYCRRSQRTPTRAPQVHTRVARHLASLSREAVELWTRAIRGEYDRMLDDGYEAAHATHFNWILERCRVFEYSDEYHWLDLEGRANLLENAIRIAAHVAAHRRDPLMVEWDAFRVLAPDYPVRDRVLSDHEVLVAAGVIKLDRAWMVRDETEKQKIKRFMNVHAARADEAVAIVRGRYVDSLEHLESLLEQAASPVLSDGSL